MSALACPHLEIVRTAKLIRQSDPEAYLITCFLRAEGVISWAGVTRRCVTVTWWCWTAAVPSAVMCTPVQAVGRM